MKKQNIIILLITALILGMIVAYWPKNTDKNTGKVKVTENQELPIIQKSPELASLENWINSEPIESIESLKGKVVLIDFWTYSCINCIRTLPYLQDLQEKYGDKGLVIIGVHSPEFAFERVPANVQKAVTKYGLTYAVVQDNDFKTWRNFKNRFWPAKYLIDKEGNIRYTHFGEGSYEETDRAVAKLLGINSDEKSKEAQSQGKAAKASKSKFKKTKETYLGTSRRDKYIKNYSQKQEEGQWSYSGSWKENKESIFLEKNAKGGLENKFKINIKAAEANLVLGGKGKIKVFVDGKMTKELLVDGDDLYNIFDFDKIEENYKEREVELLVENKESNIKLFAWTFG